MKTTIPILMASLALATTAVADVVYVTSTVSNCVTSTTECGNINVDVNIDYLPIYGESPAGDFTSAVALAPGKPSTLGARYFGGSFSNSAPIYWTEGLAPLGVTISPTLGVTGGVYRVYHVFSSAAGNVSTNVMLGVTNTAGCTLSFTNTDKFQSKYGTIANGLNTWQFLGFLTNNVDTSTPTITFFFEDGEVNSGAQRRLLVDTFMFTSETCAVVTNVSISGSYTVNDTAVTVAGVAAEATAVSVYQYANGTWTLVGQKTAGITAGNNSVTVSGLVKGGQLAATQTVGGQEGCLWGIPTGVSVGVPNPRVRLALSLRETPSTGPAGTPGVTSGGSTANIFFLGVTNRLSSAPGYPGKVLYPSNAVWQTVTFNAGMQTVANPATAAGTLNAAGVYSAGDSVAIKVYAFRTVAENGVTIYSAAGTQTATMTSVNGFGVDWSWAAVPNADGYRLIRNLNAAGFSEYVDVVGATTYSDTSNAWTPGSEVNPSLTQLGESVKWNTATGYDPVGTVSGMRSNWYTIDSLAFVIDDLTSTGPFDIYLDTIQNGTNVFYGFENAPAKTSDFGFRAPGFSGSTSGNLAGSPNSAVVVNNAALEGSKSMRIQWAWNGTANTKWLRFTTSGIGNPQVNATEPITLRFLFLQAGSPLPTPPPAPLLSVSQVGNQNVLNWVGGHRLQTAVEVTGTYTNVPQVLSANTYTNVTMGAFLGPWTNTYSESTRFFRLLD